MGEQAKRELPYELSFCNSPLSLGLIIPCDLCVSGHVVRASDFRAISEKAWEDAAQGLGKGEQRNKI